MLEQIAGIAAEAGAWVLRDEVYRGHGPGRPRHHGVVADLYERAHQHRPHVQGVLARRAPPRLGRRPRPVIDAVSLHRDYTTISVGMVDDLLAAIALEHTDAILARSRAIVRGNLAVLDAWVADEPRIRYVKPRSGTTALLRYDAALTSRDLCVRLVEETGVLLTPGSAMEVEGSLRIGYANDPAILREGLARMSGFLASLP